MSVVPPVLFLSHGAPPLADDPVWPGQLAEWSAAFARPESILVVSAHWEAAPIAVSASAARVPLLYDFWGFPRRYYDVTYAAPPAPALADAVAAALGGVARDETRGLDHGAYVPLVEMYADASLPVLQLSLPTLEPAALFAIGRALAPIREAGTLILASGFTTHNLRWFDPSDPADAAAPSASVEFDHWATEALAAEDLDALFDFAQRAPAAAIAHPRTEHWAPLYVALGAAYDHSGLSSRSVVDGFWYGLSKRSWQFG